MAEVHSALAAGIIDGSGNGGEWAKEMEKMEERKNIDLECVCNCSVWGLNSIEWLRFSLT